ncbi:hypothetical protein A2U01_0036518, partial [Trifolium medium]|nr:hypothetical protein [Trifolium medium]
MADDDSDDSAREEVEYTKGKTSASSKGQGMHLQHWDISFSGLCPLANLKLFI